jgi:glycerophosphoryl diester phosphodiesterase
VCGEQGVACSGDQFIEHPELVAEAQRLGLVLFSWGAANNDPANVQRQRDMAIDGVIADNIGDHTRGIPSVFLD